jgi:hypothetical protein
LNLYREDISTRTIIIGYVGDTVKISHYGSRPPPSDFTAEQKVALLEQVMRVLAFCYGRRIPASAIRDTFRFRTLVEVAAAFPISYNKNEVFPRAVLVTTIESKADQIIPRIGLHHWHRIHNTLSLAMLLPPGHR